ncbi:glycoside hydrolase family 97 protein [Dyadobacter sp. CY345]|uniref:glycoside hydrolase family 97 protein n=1 Tax=Dyadobacter sp. CY345 TaxID=2909335 RepID=UPI001F435070|nr:glycoside hydrolase family 97 protein [Dyadobacter sp. CY345]MCF2443250.1 glycoside hydrolase family 97 protein [Dyadobacter sp. CY345]
MYLKFKVPACLLFLFIACCFRSVAQDSTGYQLLSPDKNFVITVAHKQHAGKKQLVYGVTYKGKPIILESELGVKIENNLFESALAITNDSSKVWFDNLVFTGVQRSSKNESWKPLYGERSLIEDHYNEMMLSFEKNGQDNGQADGHAAPDYDRRSSYQVQLIVRAYDSGVAFKYFFPENKNGLFMHITGEQTEFTLPEGSMAYFEGWAQGAYSLLPLANWPGESERPLTLHLKNGLYVALLEAQMVDYARTKFKLSETKRNTLEASIYGDVDAITPFGTSWRVIMAAEKPGHLIENNDLILNLNPASKLSNTAWIKPGKVIRSGLTTKDAKACVDFAAKHHLQYVHLDAGWYGPEMKVSSDASVVSPEKDLAMQELIAYGRSKGIGILIYVNQRALYSQMDKLFPLYQKWGIKGIKFGFVQIGSNRWSHWLHEAVKKAAEFELMVDIHDEYRPTGFSRTYPNLLSQEGIRGNEEFPDATHNTILPFTRGLAGAGDYTICYFDPRLKNTHAHQLALSVVMYSPFQFLFWYDKPSAYQNEPEIEFFEKVPTVWDQTIVTDGSIGEYITTARRSGQDWFVGSITNNDARTLTLSLDFLQEGKKYTASIYADDPALKTRTKVSIQRKVVDNNQTLEIKMPAKGGQAIWFTPIK